MLRHVGQCVKCHASLVRSMRIVNHHRLGEESRLLHHHHMQIQQQLGVTAALHTSAILPAGKIKNTKRKLIKKVRFAKKSIKSSWDVVSIHSNMTVAEVADALQKDLDHVFEVLFYIPNTDEYDRPDSVIKDVNIIKQILDKSGYRWKVEEKKNETPKKNKDAFKRPLPDPASLVKRPPVVTIMGHVDHGKTTLLDALRNSNRVAQEFGGITQHIGAFSGETITFLDTPGHAAFSAMRARGARVTDMIVLVVAADDGVMRQTQESIQHAQDAQVPLIVAINKIDKREANIERTKDLLLQNGVTTEEQGGDVPVVPISALKGTNLVSLQETIITLAELMEIRADATGPVEGSVIEANKHAGKGKVATVIVQRGVLKKGSCLVAGTAWAKVRNMFDDRGASVKEAGPGVAVEVSGWKELPSAGEFVLEVESESRAGEVVSWRENELRTVKALEDLDVIEQKHEDHQKEYEVLRQERLNRGKRRGSIYNKIRTKESYDSHDTPELSIVLKGDVDGSVDAILDVLHGYNCSRCQLSVLQYGVGDVTEHDIDMASSFNGHVVAFNVGIPKKIAQLSAERNVEIHSHNVIYKMVDHLKELLNDRIPMSDVEEVIGEADVLQRFIVKEAKQKVPVAGCRCVKGSLHKSKLFKLVRSGQTIFEGPVSSLRHFKEEVNTVAQSEECGLIFKDISDEPQPGDKIVCYDIQQRKLEVDWNLDF